MNVISIMEKWRQWTSFRRRNHPVVPKEHEELLKQIREAHAEWACAQRRLDVAADHDEIDFAIFALEAAEKRYGILLKQAKAMKVVGRGYQVSSQVELYRVLER